MIAGFDIWHDLTLPGGDAPADAGRVRFLLDADGFVATFDFTDGDVVAEGTRNGELHYELGDTAELFLKPANATYYWECYATPAGYWSVLFWPGPGRRGLGSSCDYTPIAPPTVEASVDGTLNKWRTRDRGWSATLRVPLIELTQYGDPMPGEWRVLVGRYNYSRWLPRPELSCWPPLPVADFHRTDDYAVLK
jgi:hypothetical protein